jgi:hypothetical protein
MTGNVKFHHLLIIAVVGFIAYYIWVEIGGRSGKLPVFEPTSPAVRKDS